MNFLIKWLLPLIENTGETALLEMLQKMHDTNLQSYTQLVTGAYPVIDVQLENYAKSSKSTIDDEVVKRLKRVLETSAASNNVALPNMDAGTPND